MGAKSSMYCSGVAELNRGISMSKKLLITGIILAIVAVVLLNMRISQVEADQKRYAFLQLDVAENLAAGDAIALDRLRIVYLPGGFNSAASCFTSISPTSRIPGSPRRSTKTTGR